MCGIYGMIFHSDRHLAAPYKVRQFFNGMADAAVSRGDDAAGAAVVNKEFSVSLYKNALPSTKVIGFRRWSRLLRAIGEPTIGIMGHTRLGTHGDNSIKNAHPFQFDTVVGTHNGVIGNHERFGPQKPFDCDSANVIYRLGQLPAADWPDFLEVLSGSFALAFATKDGFHLARNSSSPCELAYIEEFDATVYASTTYIIAAGARTGEVGCLIRETLPVGQLWTFTPHNPDHTVQRFNSSTGYSRAPGESGTQLYLPQPSGHRTPWVDISTAGFNGQHRVIGVEHAMIAGGQCDNCGEMHPALMDHPEGPVCMDCYDELFLDEMDNDDPHHIEEGLCDMCSRESELFRFGNTENFLCRWCAAELQGEKKPKADAVLFCEGCSKECYVSDIGTTIHAIHDSRMEQGDTYACTECLERYGGVQEVLDSLDYVDVN